MNEKIASATFFLENFRLSSIQISQKTNILLLHADLSWILFEDFPATTQKRKFIRDMQNSDKDNIDDQNVAEKLLHQQTNR